MINLKFNIIKINPTLFYMTLANSNDTCVLGHESGGGDGGGGGGIGVHQLKVDGPGYSRVGVPGHYPLHNNHLEYSIDSHCQKNKYNESHKLQCEQFNKDQQEAKNAVIPCLDSSLAYPPVARVYTATINIRNTKTTKRWMTSMNACKCSIRAYYTTPIVRILDL